MRYIFLVSAFVSVLEIAQICLILFISGIPAMGEIGVIKFLPRRE